MILGQGLVFSLWRQRLAVTVAAGADASPHAKPAAADIELVPA